MVHNQLPVPGIGHVCDQAVLNFLPNKKERYFRDDVNVENDCVFTSHMKLPSDMDTCYASNISATSTHIEDETESFTTDGQPKPRRSTVKKKYRAPISIGFSVVMIVVLATSCSASPPIHSGSFSVEAVRGSVVTKISSKNSHDIINIQVNGAYVASCTLHPPSAEISEAEYKELYAIATTPNKDCFFTIYSFNGTEITVNITSAATSLTEGFIEGLAYPLCMDSSGLVFTLTERKEVPIKCGLSAGVIAGIVLTVLVVVITNNVVCMVCCNKDRRKGLLSVGTTLAADQQLQL